MAWETEHGYSIYRQGREGGGGGFSCGMACVAMVINRVTGDRPTEGAIAQTSRGFSGAYKPGTAFRAGAVRVLPSSNVSNGGTMMDNLSKSLSAYGIGNSYSSSGGIGQIVGSIGYGKPVIAHVNVGGPSGYGHFIVLLSYSPGAPKGLVILDPEYGVVACSASSVVNRRGDQMVFSGHFISLT